MLKGIENRILAKFGIEAHRVEILTDAVRAVGLPVELSDLEIAILWQERSERAAAGWLVPTHDEVSAFAASFS